MPTYSEIRKQELKHIEQSLKDDQKVKRSMARIYNRSLEDIQRQIDADIQKFAYKENVSMAEAKKLISKTDVEAFQDKAKQYVEEKNFTPKANKELRRYNVTMRTNRLELLQARINLDMIAQSLDEERLTEQHITDEAVKEFERQAGILNISVPSQNQINALAKSIALADVSGVTFSDRVWANQNELRERVNTAIERALIRGEHPGNTARELRKFVRDEHGKSKRAADRIAITETARAQSLMARESFLEAEIDSYIWIAEPSACPDCAALDDKVFKVKDFTAHPPIHPHCRCSIAGYVDDIEEEATTTSVNLPYDFIDLDSDEAIESEERIQEVIERSKILVSDYEKETGVDVIGLYKNKKFHDKNNPYDDEHARFTKYMMKRTGYDGLPQRLDDTTGLLDLYRGVSTTEDGSITADQLVDNFFNGSVDISGARQSASGRGFYFGDQVSIAEDYASKGEDGRAITAYLTKDAKLLNSDTLSKNLKHFKDNKEIFGDDADYYELVSGNNWFMDKNNEMFAMLHGYDGVDMGNGFYVIYNRSALGVKE